MGDRRVRLVTLCCCRLVANRDAARILRCPTASSDRPLQYVDRSSTSKAGSKGKVAKHPFVHIVPPWYPQDVNWVLDAWKPGHGGGVACLDASDMCGDGGFVSDDRDKKLDLANRHK